MYEKLYLRINSLFRYIEIQHPEQKTFSHKAFSKFCTNITQMYIDVILYMSTEQGVYFSFA